VIGAGASALALAGTARAQGRPVRFIVPTTAGATPDVLARLLVQRLDASQAFVVENRPGATGLIGTAEVAKAAPDGQTVGIVFMAMTIASNLMSTPPVNVAEDLTHITRLVWSYNVLVVPAASPWRTLDDVVAAARREPGRLSFASGGNGTPAHVIGEVFRRAAGIDLLHVPFNGPTPGINAVMGGQVSMMFSSHGAVAGNIRGSGPLRAIAVAAPERLPGFPDLPTATEAGLAQLVVRDWLGMVGPKGMPAAVVQRLQTDFARAVSAPELAARFADLGMSAAPSPSAEFAEQMRGELARWRVFVREANLQAS
jgi:tripartite-type tricarboxylate transporter receptor subunit TctC